MVFFDDDITWCGNSNECDITDCFRHLKNRKSQPSPDIFSQANFMDTIDCPFFQQYHILRGDKNNE